MIMIEQLTDLSPMPFGKHKGKPMQDDPVSYLHWLWTNGKNMEKDCPVHHYIKTTMEFLKDENPDLIWD